ncbi:hypothetical protein ACFOY2_52700 [Nonomuraea purpurea]|uniref:Uncharacterized protein n=1 Tax=Nonomuraea purpurea TaxID=1849276 RepID=A0ABV8GTC8_9ACTN
MNKTTIDYADYAEHDRRLRGIERHLVTAFLGGLAVGLVGMLLHGTGPDWVGQLYNPFAYLGLSLAVGASASRFGWALLTTFLGAVASLVAAMGGSALRGYDVSEIIDSDAVGTNRTIALLVVLGLLAYVTRRDDTWGDVAAGTVGAALIADVVHRAMPGFLGRENSFWPGPALVIGLLSVALVPVLRRNARARARSLTLSALFGGVLSVTLAAFVVGWIPLGV